MKRAFNCSVLKYCVGLTIILKDNNSLVFIGKMGRNINFKPSSSMAEYGRRDIHYVHCNSLLKGLSCKAFC